MNCFKLSIVPILIGLFFSFGTLDALKLKAPICHVDQETDEIKLIVVSQNAITAHLNHGDFEAGGDEYDEDCKPIPLFVFIRVYRENANETNNGIPGVYDPVDTLFVEVVDTSRNKVLGSGDTIKVYSLPSDFAGNVSSISVGEHEVISVTSNNSVLKALSSINGTGFLFRYLPPSFEEYEESNAGRTDSTLIRDAMTFLSFLPGDSIALNPLSPSKPSEVPLLIKAHESNDPWLEIRFYTPPAP